MSCNHIYNFPVLCLSGAGQHKIKVSFIEIYPTSFLYVLIIFRIVPNVWRTVIMSVPAELSAKMRTEMRLTLLLRQQLAIFSICFLFDCCFNNPLYCSWLKSINGIGVFFLLQFSLLATERHVSSHFEKCYKS